MGLETGRSRQDVLERMEQVYAATSALCKECVSIMPLTDSTPIFCAKVLKLASMMAALPLNLALAALSMKDSGSCLPLSTGFLLTSVRVYLAYLG